MERLTPVNIVIWILQVLLALHTAIGALWKVSHSAQETMPSLAAIPSALWVGLGVIEIACAVGLVLPVFNRRLSRVAGAAAALIALEMVGFTAAHFAMGATDFGPVLYWLIVAALCIVVAASRLRR